MEELQSTDWKHDVIGMEIGLVDTTESALDRTIQFFDGRL